MAAMSNGDDNVLNDRRGSQQPNSDIELANETGYEVETVDPASRDRYECPVCLGILRDPYLNDCCGHHFCKACIKQVELGNGICPLCKKDGFRVFPNLNLKREVNELPVKCVNEEHGCQWKGELGKLISTHRVDCEFAEKPCQYGCGRSFRKLAMVEHWSDCQNLPIEVLAKKVRAENRELRTLVSELKLDREKAFGEIEALKEQLKQLQPLTELVKSLREDCAQQRELTTACGKKQELLKEEQRKTKLTLDKFRNRLHEIQVQVNEDAVRRDAEVASFQLLLADVKDNGCRLQSIVTQILDSSKQLPPLQLVMKDFSTHRSKCEWWHSVPFYTHVCGYKMHLEVKASGSGNGKGTHVSVYVHLMKGENDDYLAWPVSAYVHFKLLNQQMVGENDIISKVSFLPGNAAANRVLVTELAETGCGYAQFVTHSMLDFDPNKATQYLKDNCLKFEVEKVVLRYSNSVKVVNKSTIC